MNKLKDAMAARDDKPSRDLVIAKLQSAEFQKSLEVAFPATVRRYMTPERFTRLVLQQFRQVPKLLDCPPNMLLHEFTKAAQLGLEVGLMGQAWVLPFFNGEKKRYEPVLVPGYKGLIALARRSGDVESIETHIVYERDELEFSLGVDRVCKHKPLLRGDRGAPVMVYLVARFKSGGYHFEWMAVGEIESIRQKSPGKNSKGWREHWDQMARKTVIRRAANYLPMSLELQSGLDASDRADSVPIDDALTIDGESSVDREDNNDEPIPTIQAAANTVAVGSTGVAPDITRDSLLSAILQASTQDKLDEIADLSRSLPVEDQELVMRALGTRGPR